MYYASGSEYKVIKKELLSEQYRPEVRKGKAHFVEANKEFDSFYLQVTGHQHISHKTPRVLFVLLVPVHSSLVPILS